MKNRSIPNKQPAGQAIKQNGVALLTVLLVLALASVTAVQLAELQQFSVRRSELLLHRQQAKHYLLGAERWAQSILRRDRDNNDTDHEDEDWARTPPVLPVTGGYVSGRLNDLQGRFNLNNLLTADNTIDERQLQIFSRLLEQLELPTGIASAVADWLDEDSQLRFPDGAEDSDYLLANPPYMAANQRFADPSELRLVKGVSSEVYTILQPFVCALPRQVAINVNTAPAELLAALDPTLDSATAQRLVEDRKQQEFNSVEEFIIATRIPEPLFRPEEIAVGSDFFLLNATAEIGSAQAQLHSILQRSEQQDTVISRSFGANS
ncbi:MAG: type II secretion system minor pseudopilin GspK [Gammaproteobacteria bacterium]